MKKWWRCKTAVILTLLIAYNTGAQKIRLRQHKAFPDYSSASAIAWYKGRLYVMGDDAPTLLLLNRRLREKNEIRVFNVRQKRIPYAEKPDIESAAVVQSGTQKILWLLPSFSTAYRNKAITLNLDQKSSEPELHVLTLGRAGLPHTNIEGAAMMGEKLLLANRANSQSPVHYLLQYEFSDGSISKNPERTYTLTLPETKSTVGLSGIEYAAQKDVLLLTVSTEMTGSATADGSIGDSYLAFVQNAKQQLSSGNTLVADTMINLTPVLKKSKPMKIESVAVQKIRGNKLWLYLAADNDDGTSHLFRISVKLLR